MKRTGRKNLIGFFGLIIEANPSRVGKKNVWFFLIGSTHVEVIGTILVARRRKRVFCRQMLALENGVCR